MESGVLDGVMLDWWNGDDDHLARIKEVRAAISPSALILANANDNQTPRTAPYINGFFMECYRSKTPQDWQRIAQTLAWAEKSLRPPRINCLESWYHQSRDDLALMRCITTLSLCLSDGYCLFSDPNELPTPDHLHRWYLFWSKSLGRPLGKAIALGPFAWRREFHRGTAVCVLPGSPPVSLTFPEARKSVAMGWREKTASIPSGDGDLLLRNK